MRSDLIFGAMTYVPNRYLLAKLVSKAVRELHKPGARVQDTANDVLVRFSCANPIGEARTAPEPSVVPSPSKRVVAVNPRSSNVVMFVPPTEESEALWETELVCRGCCCSTSPWPG